MTKKQFVSKQTYPDPVWIKDPANPLLSFSTSKAYHITLGNPIPMPEAGVYICGNCKSSSSFWIEKNNKNCFKCVKCNSIVETS